MIEGEKNFYIRDGMALSGTDEEELKYFCEIIDAHTEVRWLDFSDCGILHYLYTDSGKAYFLELCPGNVVKVIKKANGEPILSMPDTVSFPIGKKETAELDGMMEDLEINRTIFQFYRGKNRNQVITSRALRKTMSLHLPVKDSIPSIERDMLLAKKIGDLGNPFLFYTVLRYSGNVCLAVGMFSYDPKRVNWTEVTKFALDAGSVKALFWHMDQENGLEIRVQYQEETEALRSAFPEWRFVPFHRFQTCDSGHIAERISWGWQDPDNEDVWFISGKAKAGVGSWKGIFLTNRREFVKQAELIEKKQKVTFESKEVLRDFMIHILSKSGLRSKKGKRLPQQMIKYVLHNFYEGISLKKVLELVMRAFSEMILCDDISESEIKRMREEGIGRLIEQILE